MDLPWLGGVRYNCAMVLYGKPSSTTRRRAAICNLARSGYLHPRKWASIEDCERVDVPQLLAAQRPTAEETARAFAVRVVEGVPFVLKRRERWPGAWFWFLMCPNPQCASRSLREYLLHLPDAPPGAWGCRSCLRVQWSRRRYHLRTLGPNAPRTHRSQVRAGDYYCRSGIANSMLPQRRTSSSTITSFAKPVW